MDILQNTEIPLIKQIQKHWINESILDNRGTHTYQSIAEKSFLITETLFTQTGKTDLKDICIAHMAVPSAEYVMMQWGIWLAGGIAIPLSISYPFSEWEYIVEDTKTQVILASKIFEEELKPFEEKSVTVLFVEDILANEAKSELVLPKVSPEQAALIIYTSGTTSKPKGVVTSHQIIANQITTLVEAWGWTSMDFTLHTLPLHHVHGIINILYSALWVGAKLEFLMHFDEEMVWRKFVENAYTVYMAVPTIYYRLIKHFEKVEPRFQRKFKRACGDFRLMVSGSAALPVQTLEKWEKITGRRLLERYGMTEIGMALSNPLEGERKAGFVGKPLPSVEIKLVDENGEEVAEAQTAGEIYVKSPSVFLEYWNKKEATQESFKDDWFKTGDIAMKDENDDFKILGRDSVDILKVAGYKVSALEIEAALTEHEDVESAAVVGLPDEDKGEIIAAALVMKSKQMVSLTELKDWCKEKLAPQKNPKYFLLLKDLPRNTMGKVLKPEVQKLF